METQLGDIEDNPINPESSPTPKIYLRKRRRFRKDLINSFKDGLKEILEKKHTRQTSEAGINKPISNAGSPQKEHYQIIETEKDEPGTKIILETEVSDKDNGFSLPTLASARAKSTPGNFLKLNKAPSERHDSIKQGVAESRMNNPKTLSNFGDKNHGWKKIKQTLNAVKFKAGTEILLDEKSKEIMKGDNAIQNKIKKWQCYLRPDSGIKYAWDIFIAVTIFYHVLVVGFRWAERLDSTNFVTADLFVDGLLLFDMIITFITGRTYKNQNLINRKEIAKNYLRDGFTLDLISLLPLYLINNDLYLFKLLRIFHLQRFFRFLRHLLIRISTKGIFILQYTKFFLLSVFGLHMLICFWIFVGEAEFIEKPTWISAVPEYERDSLSIYIASAYFVTTTASTVGYGDTVPVNSLEMIVCMFLELLGIVVVSIAQSKTMQILQEEAKFVNRTKVHDLEVELWLYKKEKTKSSTDKGFAVANSPLALVMNSIQNYFRFHVAHDLNGVLHNEFEFYHQTSPEIQHQIVTCAFNNYMKKFQVFFSQIKDEGFLREIAIRMNPKLFYSEQKIIKRGTGSRGLYFMISGEVLVSYMGTPMTVLPENSFFGDAFLLGQNSDLDYVVTAENNLKCLFINKKSFFEVCQRYHHSFQTFQKFAYQRKEYFKELKLGIKRRIQRTNDSIIKLINTSLDKDLEQNQRKSQENSPLKPGSFLKKKWAEDGEKMKISEEYEDPNDEDDVIYVADVDIPDGIYSKDITSQNNESCEVQDANFRSTHADFLPNFNRTNASDIFGKKDSHEFSTSQMTAHAGEIPQILKSYESSRDSLAGTATYGNLNTRYDTETNKKEELKFLAVPKPEQKNAEGDISLHSHDKSPKNDQIGDVDNVKSELDTTIDNKPSLRQILNFYDNLNSRQKKFLTTRIRTVDLVDSDPNTSIDSGDYSSTQNDSSFNASDLDDDSEADLNNSMEVPLDQEPKDLYGIDAVDEYIDSIDNRVEMLHYKMARISKTCRTDIMDDWKTINRTKKRYASKKLSRVFDQEQLNPNIIQNQETEIDTQRPLISQPSDTRRILDHQDVFMLETKETARDEERRTFKDQLDN